MGRFPLLALACLALALLAFSPNAAHAAYKAEACPLDKSWLTNPSMPTEVKKSEDGGKESSFCDFYQFSWQAYFYLMEKDKDGNPRFMNSDLFPVYEFNEDPRLAENSCDAEVTGHTLRAGLDKGSFTPGQAGSDAVIYDQNSKPILYDMRFNREMCDQTGSAVEMQKAGVINFPGGTTELKFAWTILGEAPVPVDGMITYTPTSGDYAGQKLGLVGLHIAVATPDHPEFVWVTFWIDNTAPVCGQNSEQAYLMTSAACAKDQSTAGCDFNEPKAGDVKPTNICQVFPEGSDPSDPNGPENISFVQTTNQEAESLASGTSGWAFAGLYEMIGALWVSDIAQSDDVSNQRGSLRLANPAAETTFQDVDLHAGFVSNCFGCHNYEGTSSGVNNVSSRSLSHIFRGIVTGQGKYFDYVSKQVIMNNAAAPGICPSVCNPKDGVTWNGQWTNLDNGTSVCGCKNK